MIRVPRLRPLFSALAIYVSILSVSAQPQPNFSGTWKLKSQASTEIYTIEQTPSQLKIAMSIADAKGRRAFTVASGLDGKPKEQSVDGKLCTMTAHWLGNKLQWEIYRETAAGVFHNRRVMTLSPNGRVITAERTNLRITTQPPFTEIWEKQ